MNVLYGATGAFAEPHRSYRWQRTLAIMATALIGAGLVSLPTAGVVLARSNPRLAVALWPWASEANATLAIMAVSDEVSVSRQPRDATSRATVLATRSLAHDPINTIAASAMAAAQLSQGRQAVAERALAYSEHLSRREVFTQLMLIQLAVSKGNVDAALTHYNRALQTSETAPDILFPVLLVAADKMAVTTPLTRMLSKRPVWWLPFTLQFVQRSTSPTALVSILTAERLRMDVPLERQAAVAGMMRLLVLGRVDLAAELNRQWQGPRAGLLTNGNFSRPSPLPPFEWGFPMTGDGSATIEPVETGGRALMLTSTAGNPALARQLVNLSPGRYRLSTRSEQSREGGGLPELSVTCSGGANLGGVATSKTMGRVRGDSLDFEVSSGCAGQWVQIGVTAGADPSAPPVLVDEVILTRRDGPMRGDF